MFMQITCKKENQQISCTPTPLGAIVKIEHEKGRSLLSTEFKYFKSFKLAFLPKTVPEAPRK